MSTRSFIHPTRFMQALLILSICFILAGSAFAARPDNKDRGKNDKPNVSRHEPVNKDNARPGKVGDYKRPNNDRDNKPDHRFNPAQDNNHPNQPGRHVSSWDRNRDRDQNRHIGQPRNYQPPVRRKITVQYRYPSHANYRPAHYTHWVFDIRNTSGCRRSVYFYFGYLPYVSVAHVYIEPYIHVEYRSAPVVINNGYYLYRQNTTELDNALSDIRSAWLDGRVDLIKRHINSAQRIAILLDGSYDYSVDPTDYADMTTDAIEQMDTVGFMWDSVRQHTNGDYTAFAKHTYVDDSNQQKSVYVSYTLDRCYNITEAGSSESPLD